MAPAQLMEQLTCLEKENAELRAQLEWFKRNLFGTGKSEKLDALQTRLGLDEAVRRKTRAEETNHQL